ncbi:D-alanyl-D-alanine carboxypeptidase family protein [Roseibium algae]|uniref:serine-type D-Ala-D-Ala carboxypeptidase n=1 Tax=Roseibium algae TaxID=3123038 RepID=A0ABU8TRT0_9HYPH
MGRVNSIVHLILFVTRLLACFVALACLASVPTLADTLGTRAPIALLSEPESGTILFAKQADKVFAPGSLAKVMTAATIFKALQDGELTEGQLCRVSEHAWRTGGAPSRTSTMFASIKSEISVADLLNGLLVQNANDAAIILAECLDGSEDAFAKRMTDYAQTLGMRRSRFANPTGFEVDKNAETKTGVAKSTTTARDLARLGTEILAQYPTYYDLFALPDFTWNKIYQRNKNSLLGEIRNLDGFGVGQSVGDGYVGLASVNRNGRRIVAVVAGLSSEKNRLTAMREVVEGAWDYFQTQTLYKGGVEIAEARVFGGTSSRVPLKTISDVNVLLPLGGTLDYRLRVVYSGPLKAPVEAGKIVGELRVIGKDGILYRSDLQTGASVPRADMGGRALGSIQELLFGWF